MSLPSDATRGKTTAARVGLSLAAIGVLTVVPAVWHGQYANRWQTPDELAAAAKTIGDFPASLGAWQSVSEGDPLTDYVVRELGIAGYVHRTYRHRDSGHLAALLLMVGEPGPLVRHPPDICYGNLANTLLDQGLANVRTDDSEDGGATSQFRVLDYRPPSQLQDSFSVAYGFSTGAEWAAPEWPRLAYGSSRLLYKVQVRTAAVRESSTDERLLDDFLQSFVKGFAELRAVRSSKSD